MVAVLTSPLAFMVKTRAIGKRFCPASPLASLLAPFPFLFI